MTKEEQYNYLVISYALDLACGKLCKNDKIPRVSYLRSDLIDEAEKSSYIKRVKESLNERVK